MADLTPMLRSALDEALAALRRGETGDAERVAKAVSAIVRAERDAAAYLVETREAASDYDIEACRAELQRRFALFTDACEAGASDEVLERIAATGSAG